MCKIHETPDKHSDFHELSTLSTLSGSIVLKMSIVQKFQFMIFRITELPFHSLAEPHAFLEVFRLPKVLWGYLRHASKMKRVQQQYTFAFAPPPSSRFIAWRCGAIAEIISSVVPLCVGYVKELSQNIHHLYIVKMTEEKFYLNIMYLFLVFCSFTKYHHVVMKLRKHDIYRQKMIVRIAD